MYFSLSLKIHEISLCVCVCVCVCACVCTHTHPIGCFSGELYHTRKLTNLKPRVPHSQGPFQSPGRGPSSSSLSFLRRPPMWHNLSASPGLDPAWPLNWALAPPVHPGVHTSTLSCPHEHVHPLSSWWKLHDGETVLPLGLCCVSRSWRLLRAWCTFIYRMLVLDFGGSTEGRGETGALREECWRPGEETDRDQGQGEGRKEKNLTISRPAPLLFLSIPGLQSPEAQFPEVKTPGLPSVDPFRGQSQLPLMCTRSAPSPAPQSARGSTRLAARVGRPELQPFMLVP